MRKLKKKGLAIVILLWYTKAVVLKKEIEQNFADRNLFRKRNLLRI